MQNFNLPDEIKFDDNQETVSFFLPFAFDQQTAPVQIDQTGEPYFIWYNESGEPKTCYLWPVLLADAIQKNS